MTHVHTGRIATTTLLAALAVGCNATSRYATDGAAIDAARAAIAEGARGADDDGATVVVRASDRILVTLSTNIGVPIGDVRIPYCVVLYESSEFSDVFAPCEEADVKLITDTLNSGGSLAADAVESAPSTAPRPGDLRTWPESWLARLVEDERQTEGLQRGLARCFAALEHEGRLVSIEAHDVKATGSTAVQTDLTIRIKPADGPEFEESASATMRPGLEGETRYLVECGGEDQETVPMHYSAVRGIGCDSVASAIWTTMEARALRYLPNAAAGIAPPYPELAELYAADGDWYKPVGGAVTLNETDRVCVARLKAREDLLSATTVIPDALEKRLAGSVGVFRTLRKVGRTFPEGYRVIEPTPTEDGGTALTLVDARCKDPNAAGCPRIEAICPATGPCTAEKEEPARGLE